MSRLAALILIAASAATGACVSTRKLGDNQPCPCAPGWTCDDARNVCTADIPDGGLPEVAPGCGATCDTPAGTVQPLPDNEAVYAAVQGRWMICRNWTGAPGGTIGIEFGPATSEMPDGGDINGNAYYLVAGPAGPVRGQGFDYQLTYLVDGLQLYIYTASSGNGGLVRYSPCPAELQLTFSGAGPSAILVPFGG